MANISSQLISAQAENKASDYSSGCIGRFWINTSTSLLKFDDGSAVRTVVTTDNTQTLTNKSLSDSTTFIVDNSDATKKAQFECSSITTSTTRTYTLPDANLTFVGTSTTQTLSNKKFSDAITQTEISTPSTPSSNDWKLYFKTDGLYQLDDAGTETKFANNLVAYASKTHADTGATLAEGFTVWTLTNGNNDSATIPAASSNAGKIFKIKLASTTASFNTLTLNRSSSDTFTLADGTTGATSLLMYTGGETYELLSDGSSVWQVLAHRTETPWTSFTVSITGSGSNPTKGTIVRDAAYWKREGDTCYVRWDYAQTGGGGAAGSGQYYFSVPVSMDTAQVATDDKTYESLGPATKGDANDNSQQFPGYVVAITATTYSIHYHTDGAGNLQRGTTKVGSTNSSLAGTANFNVNFSFPVSGWKA